MWAIGITAAVVLLCTGYGARAGLGKVARQIIASCLALVLATYLSPLIATAFKAWLPFGLVWFVASLAVFFFVAIAAHKTLALFAQGIYLPKWLSLTGGGLLMGGIGALGMGLLLWAVQFSVSLQSMAASAQVARSAGLYRWACAEVDVLVRLSLLASGIEGPLAASLGRLSAEPGFYLQQVVSLALSSELKVFWEDANAQELMQQQDDLALSRLFSGQQLLQNPAAQNLVQALPFDTAQAQIQFIKQVRQVWQVKLRLMQDAEIQALLADGSLAAQAARQDLLGLFLNPHWQPFLRRIQAMVMSPVEPPKPLPAPVNT